MIQDAQPLHNQLTSKFLLLDLISGPFLQDQSDQDGKTLPTEFRLFKFGINRAYHDDVGDHDILFTQEDAKRLMDTFYSDGRRFIPIDRNHDMMNGGDQTAAGKFIPEVREDGIYASQVTFTPSAAQQLLDGEYLYYSPTVEYIYDEESETWIYYRLLPCALTNMPALKDIMALINSANTRLPMCINNTKKDINHMNDDTKLNAQVAVETFTAAQANDLRAEKARLEDQIKSMRIDALLDEAQRDGKLAPAKRATFAQHAKIVGEEGLKLMLSELQPVLPTQVQENHVVTETLATDEPSEMDIRICQKRGYDIKWFMAEKRKVETAFSNKTKNFSLSNKEARKAAKTRTFFHGIQ